ncbi:hypothetical protein Tco_0170812, partial [Tanacetum coccineum]
LEDEGLSSRGNKLNSIFIIAEVTFTKSKQPTYIYLNIWRHPWDSASQSTQKKKIKECMVDSQPMEEEFQRARTRDAGTETHEGPTEPVLQTQKNPSPSLAFIKENINVLRTMIKEHDQQAKMKATPRKLAYADSDKEAPARSLAREFSNRFSLESSGKSNTRRQAHFASKS